MDGESFDRLSVVVDRLRNRSTRREALLAVLGGAFAGIAGAAGDEAAAKNKNRSRKNCRGYGGRCDRNNDCCNGRCINGYCFYTGNGGGGGGNNNNCGGRTCTNGWRCCKQNGVSVCVPPNYPTCCGNNAYGSNYRCCGGAYGGACPFGGDCCGFNSCCQSGWKCCSGRTCIPRDWDCDDFYRQSTASSGLAAESKPVIPSMAPTPVDDADWISLAE